MTNNHQQLMTQLISAVYDGKGVTKPSLRTAIKTAVASGSDLIEGDDAPVPANLRPYLHKVSRYAYKVTDHDIETLKTQGYSEEAIFELTVSAAVGAGLGRLSQGLAALHSEHRTQMGVNDAVK